MLKKLRIKFILVPMLIVTIMFGVIFAMIYISASRNLEREGIQMMRSFAMDPHPLRINEKRQHDRNEAPIHIPFFTVFLDKAGKIAVVEGDSFDLSDEKLLKNMVRMAEEMERDTGVLKEYGFRFLWFENQKGKGIIFADMSSERSILNNIVKTSVMVGGIAFLLFLGICYLLSAWTINPVKKAWQKQKQFIADASHELKTPLTVIITDVELLGELQSPEEKERVNRSILEMSNYMRGLVESMLELARMDNGDHHRSCVQVPFDEIVSHTVMMFEPILFEKGLSFSYDIEPDIMINGYKEQLCQLVTILLDNAGKYASAGGNVKLTLKKGKHKRCILSVANEGNPISEEDKKHLFDRFYRADKARTLNHSYGLGLSIAKSIVHEHHGKIWVESHAGYNIFYTELL